MRIPDGMTPLIGWRSWNVFMNGLLSGQAHQELWPPYQAFRAGCYRGNVLAHLNGKKEYVPAPAQYCTCGIHCYKTRELLQPRLDAMQDQWLGYGRDYHETVVWGSIKVWGTIIEHRDGFRAEFAYPDHLTAHDPHIAKLVEHIYGVPCEYRELPKREYGAMVGASRWQQRQLVGGRRGGKTTDWREILRAMVHRDPKETWRDVADRVTITSGP